MNPEVLTAIEQAIARAIADNQGALSQLIAQEIRAVQKNSTVQVAIALGVGSVAAIVALIVLVAALLGNHTAQSYIAVSLAALAGVLTTIIGYLSNSPLPAKGKP